MSLSYLSKSGLTYFWQKIKSKIPTKTSDLTNDSHFTVDANYVHTDNNYTTAEKTKLANIKQCYIDQTAHIIELQNYYEMTPYYVTFTARNMDDSSLYNGRFVIEDTEDNETWNVAYTSSSNESSVTYYYAIGIRDEDQGILVDEQGTYIVGDYKKPKQVRCTLYEAGGTTRKLAITYAVTQIDGTGINAKINSLIYTPPSYTAYKSGFYKITTNSLGHVISATPVTKTDITGLGIPGSDTTYSVATTSANGLMSSTDKSKLNGISNNANNYSHPTHTSYSSGIYKITVDDLGHVTSATLVAKSDITALGIPGSDTTYSNATTTTAGLMSADDKTKLDGVDSNANNYSHPTHTAYASGLYKITTNSLGHVTAATAVSKTDITALGIPAQDTTYSVATSSSDGLMSASDKAALDVLKTLLNKEIIIGGTIETS